MEFSRQEHGVGYASVFHKQPYIDIFPSLPFQRGHLPCARCLEVGHSINAMGFGVRAIWVHIQVLPQTNTVNDLIILLGGPKSSFEVFYKILMEKPE